jgi:hypothetical protein
MSSICMLVGGLLTVCVVMLCGRWCLRAFYVVYGGKKMTNFEDCNKPLGEINGMFGKEF